jgi:hypothetical protein
MNRTLRRISVQAASGLLGAAGFATFAAAQQPAPQPAQQIRTPRQTPLPVNPDFSKLETETLKVQGLIYLIAGAGGNIAVQTGDVEFFWRITV